ncbi:MAG: BglG family transcription antiterminator LicT [Floccifex sp.]
MIIKRVLTNNAVVIEENKEEKIVCGKGIAFKKRPGMLIDESLINQVFVLEKNSKIQYENLILNSPIEYVEIASEIIKNARIECAKPFPDSIVLTLADHLHAAVVRIQDGLEIRNSLLWDIQNFYDVEYEVGLKGIQLIREKLKIELPKDEAGFIALHLVNAQLDDLAGNHAYQITKVIREITTIMRHFFSIHFETSNVYYYRFITHLKFFALRLFEDHQYQESDNELLGVVKEKFKLAYQCVLKIGDFLNTKYGYRLNDEEILYLTIHIHRVVSKSKEK